MASGTSSNSNYPVLAYESLKEAGHVAEAEVGDAVVIKEENVERVQGPRGLAHQARPQRHHQPDQQQNKQT